MAGCCGSPEPLEQDDHDLVQHFRDLDIDEAGGASRPGRRSMQLVAAAGLAVVTGVAYVLAF
ncbi:MAG: hypothetical protein SVU88_04950 [Candidatus Nanohaloarchaea archaeon]|nr:hypothetical protein [Candidatus Nanohaloarchaea archaeon]